MKSVLLIRHAKSSWDFFSEDIDRPLNDRGNKNAPEMAKRLLQKDIPIDAFVSSPAVRAFTTATFFAEAYQQRQNSIIVVPSLYHAAPEVFYHVIEQQDNRFSTVALFSHNPGITEFVNSLTNTRIDNMPTCGIFAIKCEMKTWNEFRNAKKTNWFFDYPKSTHI